jgi:opacity protein-like surface antigen
MKTILIAAAAAAALLAAPAFAQAQEVYASAGIGVIDSSPVKLGAATFRLGANVTPVIGFEGEASVGVSGDQILGVDYDMNTEFGAFVTLRKAFGEKGSLIARVGYATSEVEASAGPFSVTDDQSGAAYGLGVQGQIGANSAIRLDWTRYSFDEDSDAIAVSFVHTFN